MMKALSLSSRLSCKSMLLYRSKICLALLLCTSGLQASNAYTQQSFNEPSYDRSGSWYLSAGAGFSFGSGDEQRYQQRFDAAAIPATLLEYDDDRGGWYFGFGLQPWRFFAIEIDYLDLAQAEIRIGADNANMSAAQTAIANMVPLATQGYGARLVGIIPFEHDWRLLLKLGYHQWELPEERGGDEMPTIALALDRYITSNINLVFSVTRYEITDKVAPYASVGIAYYFGQNDSSSQEYDLDYQAEESVPAKKPVQITKTKAPAPEPKDLDNDGVFDDKDQCPLTAINTKVDSKGCKIVQLKRLQVNFESASSALIDIDREQLMQIAQALKDDESMYAVIEGHTDISGSDAFNKTLSTARAETVKQLLTDNFAVPVAQLQAIGLGSSQPIASNDTASGKQKNRRVMIQMKARADQ